MKASSTTLGSICVVLYKPDTGEFTMKYFLNDEEVFDWIHLWIKQVQQK